ncbi:hypothetical protein COU60_03305 [Candidatus Pacearchaeota archaeon CG10_big_fil_rev_8_21_14_0_10_34_76]|nr:MAG: hypothetical protein COU60_03305 [Candidatus Pacearchaeota archaeon CG10_big_fil_rev_8_21_14_0_10_34_76]
MLKTKPSARIKRRYILLQGKKDSIEKSIIDYVGILGWAKAAPVFVKNRKNQTILAVNREEIDKVIGSFAVFADEIKVLRVSGTLKGLEK